MPAFSYLQLTFVATVCLLVLAVTIKTLTAPRRKYPLPPGPPPLPIVGNAADLPKPGLPEFRHWIKHKHLYGPISSISVMGQRIVLIHSASIATELMDKRSNIHSDRPFMYFVGKMCGLGTWLGQVNNNALLRAYRRDVHSVVGSKPLVANYAGIQETGVRRFLLRTLRDPQHTVEHVGMAIAGIILQITYGYEVDQRAREDPLVQLVDEFMLNFSDAGTPGKWLVDILPWLHHLPDWMPGTAFKRVARKYRRKGYETAERPYRFTRREIQGGTNGPSMTASLLQKEGPDMSTETEYRIKISAVSLYTGGADTQIATLQWFLLATLLHPHAAVLAQQEIDAVIPATRLPTFADRDDLPYTNAFFKEVVRWNPIAPTGLPHTSSADDTISVKTADGDTKIYSIPKGSMLLPNIWSMLRDPKRYQNPDLFEPKRFLGADAEQDPALMAFGFGRRICPGRILADASAWLMMAQTLACFDIKRKDGVEVKPEGVTGLVHYPKPGFAKALDMRVRDVRKELLERLDRDEVWGKEGEVGDSEKLKSVVVDFTGLEGMSE